MQNPDLIRHLSTRRTVPSVNLNTPVPDTDTLNEMLAIAARVPDHGKLAPWRFIIYQQKMGEEIGRKLEELWLAENPDAVPERLEQERARFRRAPLVVGVVSKTVEHKIPEWEQVLSAGAVCLNLVHAAYAYGFSAQWLTEWYSYNDIASQFLGTKEGERFAGFVHIGTPKIVPVERARPEISEIITFWNSGEDT